MKKPLVILTGPTAVGKSELSISLAKKINGEIISADSMQVYRHMDIGSAKIRQDQMQGVPHYLIDELDPKDEFNVVKFKEMAVQYMERIYQKDKVPILVGGTGFYIQAVLYDIDFSEEAGDDSYRISLEKMAQEGEGAKLHQMLSECDPASALAIHPNNVKRVIRALEYYHLTGRKISEHNSEQREKESPYNFSYFVLNDKREKLYERIDQRVDKMMAEGLHDEVLSLKERGCTREMVSMQGLGYKELLAYIDGELSLEEAVYILKRDSRHFAKRQITWFKREKCVYWVNKDEFEYQDEKILSEMINYLKERKIVI